MTSPRVVLAFCAHPDDAEMRCGGTLLLLAKRGWKVHIATASPGDCGSMEVGPDEIARTRTNEARLSAARLGGEYHCLKGRDLVVFDDGFLRPEAVAALRRADPDCVITHYPQDYMPDHDGASALARAAVFTAPIPNYVDGSSGQFTPTTKGIVPLYYFGSPLGGVDWKGDPGPEPHFYVDITSVEEEKAELLAIHASQREWLRRHHGSDQYIADMRNWDAAVGAKVGVSYAEAFFVHRGYAYSQKPVMQEALRELVIGA